MLWQTVQNRNDTLNAVGYSSYVQQRNIKNNNNIKLLILL